MTTRECPDCGGTGFVEVIFGHRWTGTGYGDCVPRIRIEDCERCERAGEVSDDEEE